MFREFTAQSGETAYTEANKYMNNPNRFEIKVERRMKPVQPLPSKILFVD